MVCVLDGQCWPTRIRSGAYLPASAAAPLGPVTHQHRLHEQQGRATVHPLEFVPMCVVTVTVTVDHVPRTYWWWLLS